MKVTAIKQQEKQKGRYSIFVEGKYAFSLSEAALLDSKLASGHQLSSDQLKQWKRQSADDKIYSMALRYAAMRLRSKWEMESYLTRKEASPALADQILNKLSNIGLLNDVEFAKAWVANRRLLRPTSKRKLQQELRSKRIADEIVEQILAEAGGDEQATLRDLVAKKRHLPKYKNDLTKLMQYLARQGFGYEDIKTVVREG